MCFAAITESEAAEIHFTRWDLGPSEHVLGCLANYPVENVFLVARGLGECGDECRRRTRSTALSRRERQALSTAPAMLTGRRRMDDIGRQFEALGERPDELVRLTTVLEILPAFGRPSDDELKKHIKRR